MKRIAFFLLFAAFPAFLQAQITKDDLLISRQQYEKLQSYQEKYLRLAGLQARYDSALTANRLQVAELEKLRERDRLQRNTIANLEGRNFELQENNRELNTRNLALRTTANKYRFRYEQEPRYRERMTYSILWASLMSAGFYFAMQDDYKQAAFIGTGLASAATITLSIALTKKQK